MSNRVGFVNEKYGLGEGRESSEVGRCSLLKQIISVLISKFRYWKITDNSRSLQIRNILILYHKVFHIYQGVDGSIMKKIGYRWITVDRRDSMISWQNSTLLWEDEEIML